MRCDPAGYIAKFEENVMLAGIVVHVKGKVIGWAQALVKALVQPARSGTAAAAGIARDSVRRHIDLIAENALLRQQLIVLRRNVGRPVFVRSASGPSRST